jgi:nitrogen fixation/metabolism regulation signal transduction histidine kinase
VKQRFRQRFRWITIIQILLLTATLSLLASALTGTDFRAVPLILGMVAALQVFLLIRSVHAHVNALEDFFAAVAYEDFTQRFLEEDLDGELRDAFNRILARFRTANAERELQAGYLDTVVRHVPVALLAAKADGSLSIVNNPARRLTGLTSLRHLDDLAALAPDLPGALRDIEAGQQRLLQTRLRGIPAELRVSVSEIRRDGAVERLYSLENLSGELSARESSAWRNLIRVLTHEIMNTLTPVSSLAETAANMLDESATLRNDPAIDDIREAIETIGRRSSGLTHFVTRYRELMQVPSPELSEVVVADMFRDLINLEKQALHGIETNVSVQPQTLTITADRQLIEQVLINVIKNSIEALKDQTAPSITLSARLDYGRTLIDIEDNGPGIPQDLLDEVFIPFFTTKRDGSGIGLSLSRQIMTAHGGDIIIERRPTGTRARLVFV